MQASSPHLPDGAEDPVGRVPLGLTDLLILQQQPAERGELTTKTGLVTSALALTTGMCGQIARSELTGVFARLWSLPVHQNSPSHLCQAGSTGRWLRRPTQALPQLTPALGYQTAVIKTPTQQDWWIHIHHNIVAGRHKGITDGGCPPANKVGSLIGNLKILSLHPSCQKRSHTDCVPG